MKNKSAGLLALTTIALLLLVEFGKATPASSLNIRVTASRKAIDRLQNLITKQRIAKLKKLQSKIRSDKAFARLVVDRHNRQKINHRLNRLKKVFQSSKFRLHKLNVAADGALVEAQAIYNSLSKQTLMAVVMSRQLKFFNSKFELVADSFLGSSIVRAAAFSSDIRRRILYTFDDSNTLRSFNITLGNKTEIQELNAIKIESDVSEIHGFDSKVALRKNGVLSWAH